MRILQQDGVETKFVYKINLGSLIWWLVTLCVAGG